MQEIKTTLVELDALRERVSGEELWATTTFTTTNEGEIATGDVLGVSACGDDAIFLYALHNAYPAIRAYIEKLERELLATQNALMERNNELIAARQLAEAGRVLVETMQSWHKDEYLHSECLDGCCGLEEHWEDWRDSALSAYHSSTRDITSKEKEV